MKSSAKHARKTGRKELNEKLVRILRFLVLFNIFAIPLYIFIFLGISVYPLQMATAELVSCILNSAGIPSSLSGIDITVASEGMPFTGSINWDCTGWKSMLAFIALVFATDAGTKKKFRALAFLPVLFIINVLRVSFIFSYVHAYGLEYYQEIHSFLFGFFMIAAALFLWVVWLKYFNFSEPNKRKSIKNKSRAHGLTA